MLFSTLVEIEVEVGVKLGKKRTKYLFPPPILVSENQAFGQKVCTFVPRMVNYFSGHKEYFVQDICWSPNTHTHSRTKSRSTVLYLNKSLEMEKSMNIIIIFVFQVQLIIQILTLASQTTRFVRLGVKLS